MLRNKQIDPFQFEPMRLAPLSFLTLPVEQGCPENPRTISFDRGRDGLSPTPPSEPHEYPLRRNLSLRIRFLIGEGDHMIFKQHSSYVP